MNDKLIKLHLLEAKTNIKVSIITLILGLASCTFIEFNGFLLGIGLILLIISIIANFLALIKIVARYLFDDDSAIMATMPFSPKEILTSKIYACMIIASISSIITYLWCDIMLLLVEHKSFNEVSYVALSVVGQVTNQIPAVFIAASAFLVQLASVFGSVSFVIAAQMMFLKRQAKRSGTRSYKLNTRPSLVGAYLIATFLLNLTIDLVDKSNLTIGGFPLKIAEIILLAIVVGVLSLTYIFRNIDSIYRMFPHFYRKGDDLL